MLNISKFKKAAALLLSCLLVLALSVSAVAASTEVSFDGKNFAFSNDSKDLFENFKGLMPGDVAEQKVKLVNNSDEKTTFSMRMKVAKQDELSEQELGLIEELLFNPELLKITVTAGGQEIYSDAAGGSERKAITETGEATSSLLELGALSPNGYSTELVVTLEVSKKLDNTYADAAANIDWEFVAAAFDDGSGQEPGTDSPDEGDGGDTLLPETPPTGSESYIFYVLSFVVALAVMIIIAVKRKRPEMEN